MLWARRTPIPRSGKLKIRWITLVFPVVAAEEARRAAYMAEPEKRKAEQEAARKAETERVMQAGQVPKEETPKLQPEVEQDRAVDTVEDPVHVIDFRVYATRKQLNALKTFLNDNGIRFEPVPKQ